MALLTLTLTGIEHTGDVARFIELTRAVGVDRTCHFPLLVSADGISASVSIDLSRIPIDYLKD